MGAAEALATHKRSAEGLTLRDALVIGVAQVGALIPGVSRSGATFTGAMFLGFNREDAARVSFLLGIPAIFLAGAKELWELHKAGLPSAGWSILALGLVVSSLSAFAAIWGLMRFLRHSTTWPLVIYRALFGAVLVIAAALHWIS
jgi:undecaprenyl-diphosphatase